MFISGEVRPMKKRPPTHTHLQENMAEVLSGWGAALLPLVLEVLNISKDEIRRSTRNFRVKCITPSEDWV